MSGHQKNLKERVGHCSHTFTIGIPKCYCTGQNRIYGNEAVSMNKSGILRDPFFFFKWRRRLQRVNAWTWRR